MDAKAETWCDRDGHKLFEYYIDFNEWLDSEEAASARESYGVDGISVASKAFFAGDKVRYDQAFNAYRKTRRHEVLNERYLCQQFTDNHWFERNLQHFDQLVDQLEAGDVVPFIGAGLSKGGGFPTWEDHLRSQDRTAGINAAHTEDLLARGEYETFIAEIEAIRGRDVFVQEVRDVFSRTGTITDTTLLITGTHTRTPAQPFGGGCSLEHPRRLRLTSQRERKLEMKCRGSRQREGKLISLIF